MKRRVHRASVCRSVLSAVAAFHAGVPAIAESSPPFTTVTADYPTPSAYCFFPGEWSGDLQRTTLRYHLISRPEDQSKYADIFVGFRRPSDPARVWLLGIADYGVVGARPTWVEHVPGRAPVALAMGQRLEPITRLTIIDTPMDLSALAGDGEVAVGYGLRENVAGSTTNHSFQEMLDRNRFAVVWRADALHPTRFGHYSCLSFSRVTQRVYSEVPRARAAARSAQALEQNVGTATTTPNDSE